MEETKIANDKSEIPIAKLIQQAQKEDEFIKDIIAKKNTGER